jgi:autotransporter-associated beta strand protein/predicted outer membrane repeat protein
MKNQKPMRSLRLMFPRILAPLPAAFAALALAPSAPAQLTPPITSGTHVFADSTTYDAPARQQFTTVLTPVWLVADGATVTIANVTTTANGGVFEMNTNNATVFTIAPSGSTGRVIFRNNITSGEGGVFYQNRNTLNITNASFIGNASTKAPGSSTHGGGAMRIGSTAIATSLTNVLFDQNYALSRGGAIRTLHGISITSGTFTGNYAAAVGTDQHAGYGGAIAAYAGGLNTNANGIGISVVRESYFAGNWASRYGGAIALDTLGYHSFNFFDHAGFADNFAGAAGGAFYDYANTALLYNNAPIIDGQRFVFTGTTGVTDFVYSGNIARGVALTADEITAARAGAFVFTATAAAKAGGFYFSGTASTRLRFDIAEGVTVAIGKAGNPSAWDSIANSDASGTTAKIELVETIAAPGAGAAGGTLVLHADNSYFQGSVNVEKGALLLGNPDARLGGAITVGGGALFGGAGELITRKQDDTVFAGRTSLTLGAGARLQVGADTAVDAETLTVAGDLGIGAGVTFSHDLFSSGSASLLRVENLTLAGAATIDLGMLATGSFALIEWAGAGLVAADLDRLTLTVDGVAGNLRSPAELSLSGSQLIVTTTVNNLAMRWTGAEGAIWTSRASGAQRNWADAAGSEESRFFNADTVVFDGVADAAQAGNRDITIATADVVVSGMEVSGTARYVFRGEGGITADAGAVGSSGFTPTGKLIKSGEGELVFANLAPNLFKSGIDIAGGVIAFDHAAQLGSGTGGIAFTDSATLRAAGAVTGTLTGAIGIAAGRTAGLEVEGGGALVYAGTLASAADATLRKTGEGALLLAGDSSGNAGAIALDAGALMLAAPAAALGGKITVGSGATLGGVGAAGAGGSVKVAAGGILEAGLDSAQPGTLTVHNLELAGGAVLRMDLFKDADGAYRKSDRIVDAGASAISGANTIDMASFASGTFNLGNLAGLAADGRVTLNGMTLPAGIRVTAELINAAGTLELVTTSDQSRAMSWTGNSGSTWNLSEADWTGDGLNQFSYGDRVSFDGAADAAHAASRDIVIDAGEVRIADMTVGGAADYTFTGGGIHASADNVQPDAAGVEHITDATGKLIKTGNGTLTLANAKNIFTGGVEIAGGVLAISHGEQLTTGAAAIDFTGAATLRANAGLALDNEILVTPGNTATVDSNGRDVTLRGRVSVAQDAAFVKEGAGVLLLEQQLAMDATGAFTVRGGTARAGAENVFTAVEGAAIVVEEGALLDFNGHDQTLRHLSGAGGVDVSGAQFTYDATSGTHTFDGGFLGGGTIRKLGAGKWTLSGSSSFDGDFLVASGTLGLGGSAALGDATLTFNDPSGGALSIEAGGLRIVNDIAMSGPATLTLETNAHAAEFSGVITASSLMLAGAGTLALSGNNAIAALAINNPLAVARRAESIGNAAVGIADGSTLEFRDIGFGQVNGALTGDRVLLTSSTMSLRGANTLRALDIAASSRVTAASTGALGGIGAAVTVRDGAALEVPILGTLAGNMNVDGGALVFGAAPAPGSLAIYGTPGSLALSGTLDFSNGGEIRLAGLLPTGIYTAAVAYGGIAGAPAYDASQGGMFMVADIVDGNILKITAYNKALEPGKDIVVAFDSLAALSRALRARLGEDFISPLAGRAAPRDAKGLWFRAIGTFMECGDDEEHLGYTDSTWAGIIGYDWISTKALMLGACFGYASTNLETTNNATTDIDMPHLGLYAARRMGDFYLSADVSSGHGSADTVRREDFGNLVTGSHKLDTFGASLEAGWVLPLIADGEIKPTFGLHYMNLSFHDYTETGKGAVRLDDIRATLLQGVARLDASKAIKLPWGLPGLVSLGAGWRQNLASKRTDVWATLVEYPDARLQIRGDEYAKSSFIAGLGVRLMLSKSALFSLAYDYDCVPFGDQNNSTGRHTFDSVLRISW